MNTTINDNKEIRIITRHNDRQGHYTMQHSIYAPMHEIHGRVAAYLQALPATATLMEVEVMFE